MNLAGFSPTPFCRAHSTNQVLVGLGRSIFSFEFEVGKKTCAYN